MGFATSSSLSLVMEGAPMEVKVKVKEVRDALGELMLPLEVIELALQKIAEFEGDIDRIANYAINLPVPEAPEVLPAQVAAQVLPQVECIEEHLSDDMVSSDSDAYVEADAGWVNVPNPTTQVVKEEETWEDPICKLFQEPHGSETHPVTRHQRGSCSAAVEMHVKIEAGCLIPVARVKTEMEPAAPAGPSALPHYPLSKEQRRAAFLEMGLPCYLVDRAFKQYGADTEDSVLLQYIWDTENNNPGSAGHSNEEETDDETEMRARVLQNVPNAAMRSLKGKENISGFHSEPEIRDSRASSSQNVSTLEKLSADFQFPAAAVEKAMERCNTPSWNATEGEIAYVVDFLAAHMESLIEEDAYANPLPDSDVSDEEDSFLGEEGESSKDECTYWDFFADGKTGNFYDDGKNGKGPLKRPYESPKPGKNKDHGLRGRPKGVGSKGGCRSAKPLVEHKCRGAVGFGIPGMQVQKRVLKEDIRGAPYFYFENVASMPVGEWERIQTHLFGIVPEFVDAMHFSCCRRSRGYIHNLPLEGREKVIKDPPMTILELMPQTRPYWPEWDTRTKLNCINTVRGSEYCAKMQKIRDGSLFSGQELTDEEKKEKVRLCSKWNLVWTSPNLATPVEANEIEAMLGFDKDHSRAIVGATAKYKALGNSFSVYTVAYHFSVLRPLYPNGIKVLSLFTGIGGAEVALHKVGLRLNVVVSVEIEEAPRRCLQTWWALTKQTGCLDMQHHDVRELKREELTELVNKYRGFDLIVGGSPCNNLTGNNRTSRTGLEGKHSTMFFEFSRVVTTVRELTFNLQGNW